MRFYNVVNGLKTGYTEKARYCLTATIKKIICDFAIAMREPTSNVRNSEVSSMLDYGYCDNNICVIITIGRRLWRRSLLLLIEICGFIIWNNRIVSTITLDINPSIEINLTINEKVKSI